jgi:hypothetical protein
MILAGAMLVGGCAANGDFGRPRPSAVSDEMHAQIRREAVGSVNTPVSEFRLTDDERQLRDLAYVLIAPSLDRNRWDGVLRGDGLAPDRRWSSQREPAKFDRTAYWTQMNAPDRRSEISAYAQLAGDARNDIIRLDPLFAVAARVADADRKRTEILAHVANSAKAERDNAISRNRENTAISAWVCRSLNERVSAYSYALERLVIRAPSSAAVEAERALAMLHGRINGYCRGGPGERVALEK